MPVEWAKHDAAKSAAAMLEVLAPAAEAAQSDAVDQMLGLRDPRRYLCLKASEVENLLTWLRHIANGRAEP